MAEQQGSRRSGGPQGRSGSGAGSSDRRGGQGRAGGQSRSGGARSGGRGKDGGDRRGSQERRGQGQGQGQRSGGSRPPRDREERTKEQAVYDGPPLPDEITGKELAPAIRAQLKSLPDKLALRVSRHLAAAGALIDEDPETAYQHTLAARARASRLAVVREAAGEAAYAAGRYSEALAELRAAKRMNGATAYLPIMADCHRALGNAKRALELAKSPAVANFDAPAKAEMTIVEAGARRDLGQFDAALRTLELAPLNNKTREPWVVRLRYAYADTLEQADRLQDALTWFHRTDAIDGEELTDAADRAAALEKRLG
ncbi:tetratricopeptide repeat protein [Nocardioides sp. YIM 152588]|uniref:tetratricopeptide repeat protein n=1 Tax=Nocardioides sp. YIM 152588 TaxID=3158259 RepID=UPI0032E37B50